MSSDGTSQTVFKISVQVTVLINCSNYFFKTRSNQHNTWGTKVNNNENDNKYCEEDLSTFSRKRKRWWW